ncbi:MAG: phosphodiester glycosidase family protein, partial [Eubacteriaceae bacterium]|nr:phosphodiester glycosidase family protein [Eubacteriaceae bacterium]
MKTNKMKCKRYSLKSIVAVMTAMCMIFVSVVPASAATGQWSGLAENEALIKDTITAISSGVTEHEVITNVSTGDDQKIDYLCEIKPDENIKLVAGYGNDDADSWSLTRTTKQAAAYEKNHPGETVVGAINADFFNMATGEPMGALVMEGEKKHAVNGRYYFGIKKDGTPVIRNNEDVSDLEMAVGGDQVLVRDGQVVEESTEYGALKYSRTAIGYKADGTIVTFVTYGKRPPVSCGRTYKEMAEMFAAAGCEYALALDGGGSSTWAARPEGTTKLEVRNSPNDGAEREVSSSILIVSNAVATGIFDHVQLTPNNEVYTPNSEVNFDAVGVDTAGFPVEIPKGTRYALADDSMDLGTIDEATGEFKANDKTGVVTVNMMQGDKVVGQTSIEVAVPDKVYFANEEISLGFDEESDLGLVVRSQERDMHYNDGDLVWEVSDESMGSFTGNVFKSSDGNSVTGTVTVKSAYDESVYGEITVIVGKLPTIVWDFEDTVDADGNPVSAEDYYIGSEERTGILTHENYGRGGKESIE